MSVSYTTINKFRSLNHLKDVQAHFIYPYLVVFEGPKNFRILNLDNQDEESTVNQGRLYTFDHEILDYTFQDYLLWLILKTGEIQIVNTKNGAWMKIICDNYENYKIKRFQKIDSKLYLISESGECLGAPYTTKEIEENFEKDLNQVTVTLKKTRFHKFVIQPNVPKSQHNGIQFFIDSGTLMIECPVIGIIQPLYTDMKFDQIVYWGDLAVLSSKSNMWVVYIKDSSIFYGFKNIEGFYYPLATHKDSFYYLLLDNEEVQICCAWKTSEHNEDHHDPDSSKETTGKLSSQDSLKLKMLYLIDIALSAEPAQVLPQLKQLFEKIDDFVFLIDNASKLCEHDILYKSLLYALHTRIFATNDIELQYRISDLMIKVDLVEYIVFKGNNSYEKKKLFEKDLNHLCITFISRGDLDLASICWLKYSELQVKLTSENVIEILNSTPHNIKMGALVIWLKNFVPPLLDENPYFIDLFVRWTTHRVFLLEQSSYWPKIGLKFIDQITNVLETSLRTISLRPISMDDLDMLKDHINYIIELKEKYKINMLLGEISSQRPSEVALIMLRRCYTEDLGAFLQDYLPSFATRYLFELDDTLRAYIENEAASCGGTIDSSRLKIFLDAFRSPTNKLDCLLQVLKVLDVPWDNTVLDLAIVASASVFKDFTVTDTDRIVAQEIQKELNYAKVKVVLKKYNFPLTCTDYMLVLHKLLNAITVDLSDLTIITGVITTYANYGNLLYINRCLRDCETRVALDYFAKLCNKQKRILFKSIITKYEQVINGSNKDTSIERNYVDFLKGTGLLNDIQITILDNLYHLKNSFNTRFSLNTIYNEKCCSEATTSWISRDGVIASSGRGRCLTQLTQTLQSRQTELFALLCSTSTSNRVRQLLENFIKTLSSKDDSLAPDTVSTLHLFKDGRNSFLLLESFSVLIDLVTNCAEEHIHYLMKYLAILNAIINTNIVVKNLSIVWKFHYIYLPMSSATATNDLINHYSESLPSKPIQNSNPSILNHSDFISFRILGNVLGADNTQTIRNMWVKEISDNAAKRLLPKVIASQDLDEILMTNLLLILSGVEATEDKMWILDTLQGQNESLAPAIMCYLSSPQIRRAFGFGDIFAGSKSSYPPKYILKSKFNINLGEIAVQDSTEETWDVKVVLFYVLRQYPDTTFERLIELCRTLNVSLNDGLSLQLISLLTTWELKYKLSIEVIGCRQIILENNELDVISKCFIIWDSIKDKDFLTDILSDFWKNGEVTLHGRLISINPYYYEIYMCIYHLIYGSLGELRNKKEYFLLNFLKEYTRKSAPKQYEFELFSVKGMFPEIGHYRLPFHLFMRDDMWSNLKSEITLETYERWLPIVALLSLDADLQTSRDMICSNALKQTMTTRKRNDTTDEDSKDNEPWRITTREEPLLRAAHRCVRHIANMEWAGACLFYVLQGCARGADQVAAAHLCYQFAQRWAALQPGNRAVRQMERLHSTLSTRHSLHKIDWACEEFVRLASEPAQLIRALYLHPNFVDKMSRHDVNRAANEIADKNGINISSIRIQILENILSKSNEENKSSSFCGLDTKKLMTAKYILKATCPKMGAIYLSRVAFDDDSDFNKSKKLRALQCLMSVVDTDTAVKVTNRERDDLWSLVQEMLYVVHLENIDMPWLVATFMQDKIRAIEQLIQAAAGNIEGLKIAAYLSRRFGNSELNRILIQLLLRAGLYEEMVPLLLHVSSPPDDILYTAWRAVIVTPFQRADYPITERQRIKCLKAVNLLPVCPFIKDEDLIDIWKNCLRCKCFGMGCLVLPYITPQRRQTLTELQKIDKRNLIASLKNLQSETYLVSGAMLVVENISLRGYQ